MPRRGGAPGLRLPTDTSAAEVPRCDAGGLTTDCAASAAAPRSCAAFCAAARGGRWSRCHGCAACARARGGGRSQPRRHRRLVCHALVFTAAGRSERREVRRVGRSALRRGGVRRGSAWGVRCGHAGAEPGCAPPCVGGVLYLAWPTAAHCKTMKVGRAGRSESESGLALRVSPPALGCMCEGAVRCAESRAGWVASSSVVTTRSSWWRAC